MKGSGPDPDPWLGRQVGPFKLVRMLGQGGMGAVYLAERQGEFRQTVALKLIRAGAGGPEAVRRFHIERQTLAALNHPGIVRLLDGGSTPEGLPYLVTEYVDGEPIDRYSDQRSLRVTDRLRLFLQACGAVHYAHRRLVVHRDLKPANILVTAGGEVKLLDFGIAKLLDPAQLGVSDERARTRMQAFTPDYASPEQIRGEPISTAADVYGLGLVLYELVTGHLPFEDTGPASLADTLKAVCETDAAPPSEAVGRTSLLPAEDGEPERRIDPLQVSRCREGSPARLASRLKGDLDAIVLKCLRKRPEDRYASVEHLADDIRRHLDGRPVEARRVSVGYLVRKFVARRRYPLLAAALVASMAVLGVASTLWQARRAERRFQEVRSLARTFLGSVHDAVAPLPGSTPARALIARTGTEYLDRLAADVGSDAGLARELAEGYLKVGDVLGNPYSANLGDTAAAVASYQKALAFAQKARQGLSGGPELDRLIATAHENLGSLLPQTGRVQEAEAHLREAVKIFESVWTRNTADPGARLDLARANESLADLLGGTTSAALGRKQEAADLYRKALAWIPDLETSSPHGRRARRARAILIMKLADADAEGGAHREALAKLRQALEGAEELARTDPGDRRAVELVASLAAKFAWNQWHTGDPRAAVTGYERAARLQEELLAKDPSNRRAAFSLAASRKNMGDLLLYQLDDAGRGLAAYRGAAELLEAQSAADPTNLVVRQNLAEALTCVAAAMTELRQTAAARDIARRGLAVAKELADRPGATPEQLHNYAYLALTVEPEDLRDPAAALPYEQKAVDLSGGASTTYLYFLGRLYQETGDPARAAEAFERTLALMPAPPPGTPSTGRRAAVEQALAQVQAQRGVNRK